MSNRESNSLTWRGNYCKFALINVNYVAISAPCTAGRANNAVSTIAGRYVMQGEEGVIESGGVALSMTHSSVGPNYTVSDQISEFNELLPPNGHPTTTPDPS